MRGTKVRLIVRLVRLSFIVAAIAIFTPPAWCQQKSDSEQTASSPFHLVSSSVGTKQATKNSEMVVEDPRTDFHPPQDHQVVVVFKIGGPGGMHHLVGSWRGPDGKVESEGNIDMETYPPGFFCYWTLTFPDSVKPGLWALELQVDGHPVGMQTFEIIANPAAATAAAPPTPPPPPSAGDVYRRVVAASVVIDNQNANGELIRRGSGFFTGNGEILTAFQVIDGASSLRLKYPDGSETTSNQILAWSRRQDWAVVKVDGSKEQPLERAQANSWKVGDHAYQLDSPSEGSWTIETVGISGIRESQDAGERVNTTWAGGDRTIGSPVLDEYGRVIGVLGGTLVPGAETIRSLGEGNYRNVGEAPANSSVPLVAPISMIPTDLSSRQPVTLDEIAAKGEFVHPIGRDSQVMMGSLCRNYQKVGAVMISPQDPTDEFSRIRDSLGIVITWTPSKRTKSTLQYRIYDLDNHAVEQDKPSKIEFQQNVTVYTAIKLPITQLKPGIYRVDVVLGDEPQWRGFFRVTE